MIDFNRLTNIKNKKPVSEHLLHVFNFYQTIEGFLCRNLSYLSEKAVPHTKQKDMSSFLRLFSPTISIFRKTKRPTLSRRAFPTSPERLGLQVFCGVRRRAFRARASPFPSPFQGALDRGPPPPWRPRRARAAGRFGGPQSESLGFIRSPHLQFT